MIKFIFIILLAGCSAANNLSLGYDFGQHYSRIRIYEYDDYSDAKFLKFNIYGPTTLATWSITTDTDGKCTNYLANIHFDLQYGAYPLLAPLNESFPETYISTRHDLVTSVFNRTSSNGTVQLTNPLRGIWFALAFVERLLPNGKSKNSPSDCTIYLTTGLDYQAIPITLTLTLNQPLQIILSNNATFIYTSYYTLTGNSRLNVLSKWSSDCDILILARINGLPSFLQYDYQTVCKNSSCSLEIDQLSAFTWIYFQISISNQSCLNNPIHVDILIRSTECVFRSNNNKCIQSYPMRRIMFNSYYDFLYVPLYTDNNLRSIILNGNDLSIYSYEFIVDDRNIGGTIHFDFQSQIRTLFSLNTNINILGCLSKIRPRIYDTCEKDYKIFIDKNSFTVRSLPYPEMALWYLTLKYSCNDSENECFNASVSVTFQISSSQCTRQQCGKYGVCRVLTSQQNIFSTCTCIAGYRGYGCTDSSQANLSKYLPSVLFLTLSNLMFIPAIILAIYHHLYIEALVYFFNMFFSTFYHACDQDIRKFCIFKYDGLQLSDFIGSYASFVITLITMSIIPRSIKAFLFMLGLLTCIAINARDRFDILQFIGLIVITFSFTILTWVVISIKRRRLQPPRKRLLITIPGFLISTAGIILFVVLETDDNYWYIHSIWHICMATSILFFLPHKKEKNEQRTSTIDSDINSSTPTVGIINEGAILSIDDTS